MVRKHDLGRRERVREVREPVVEPGLAVEDLLDGDLGLLVRVEHLGAHVVHQLPQLEVRLYGAAQIRGEHGLAQRVAYPNLPVPFGIDHGVRERVVGWILDIWGPGEVELLPTIFLFSDITIYP